MKKQFLVLVTIFVTITFISCKKETNETRTPGQPATIISDNRNDVFSDDNTGERIINLGDATANAKISKLNVSKFGQEMHKALKDSVTGYVLQLTQNGTPIYNLKWNWAKTPTDGGQGWEFNTRMHVASVSKYLTALGMMKALKLKGISFDAKIINYLPTYWNKGPNINQISFRNLLRHESGFVTGGSATNFATMKSEVAQGIIMTGGYDYENMNFGLMRILIPVIMGDMSKDMLLTDFIWDNMSVNFYRNFMQANIFTPSGVSNADFVPQQNTKNALAYKFPHNNESGWNSGNLASVSGGAGWRLSVSEVLKVMDHARRKGDILPASDVQFGLDNGFGIDQIISTTAGTLYNKNGAWNGNGASEQCVAYFFPDNMEVAVFVNSKLGKSAASLRGLVATKFIASLQ